MVEELKATVFQDVMESFVRYEDDPDTLRDMVKNFIEAGLESAHMEGLTGSLDRIQFMLRWARVQELQSVLKLVRKNQTFMGIPTTKAEKVKQGIQERIAELEEAMTPAREHFIEDNQLDWPLEGGVEEDNTPTHGSYFDHGPDCS